MNKKGFTLIELLAVIIILGILMIIAIPSVTKYISDSRKNAYVDTAKEIVGGARNIVNEGKLEMYDTNTTYYIPTSYVKTENALKSPYGDFTEAYIGVIYDGKGYKYYWTSVDDAGQGVSNIVPIDELDIEDIESDLKNTDITDNIETTGIGNRSEIKILQDDETWREIYISDTVNNIPEEGKISSSNEIVCKKAVSLHTKTCENTSDGCGVEIGNGNSITYGTIPNGTPKAGDAYDCKVAKDGDYTERFYFIKSYGRNSILIYYKSMNDQTTYPYNSSNEIAEGPLTAYQYLPSTSEWDNPGILEQGTRQLTTETGSTSLFYSGKPLGTIKYTGKAARLMTYQEAYSACGSFVSNMYGYLNRCTYLLENVGKYEKSSGTRSNGYWLETVGSHYSDSSYSISGDSRIMYINQIGNSNSYGVRPLITVKTSNIEK